MLSGADNLLHSESQEGLPAYMPTFLSLRKGGTWESRTMR